MNFHVVSSDGSTQNVKVTPHTTVLQILEEVCQTKGISAEGFNLTYDNIVLDKSCKLHYGGLSDGTQLKLLEPAENLPETGEIIISFEVEFLRFIGNFTEDDSVWTVVTSLCPRGILDKEDAVPAISCNQYQVAGVQKMQETNLRLLRLKPGRVVMRLEMRNLGAIPKVNKPYSGSKKSKINKIQQPESYRQQQMEQLQQLRLNQHEQQQHSQNMKALAKERNTVTSSEGPKAKEPNINPALLPTVDDFQYMGERNAMLFKMPDNYTVTGSLPDDFFDLQLDEAKNIYKNLLTQRLELEHQPLMTQAMRKQMVEEQLHKKASTYKKCVIRVVFPDQIVLQGVFDPTELVQSVINFVRGHLEAQNLQFYLYTAPPKTILSTDKRLIDLNCVPLAKMYFGLVEKMISDGQGTTVEQFIRRDLMTSSTTYEMATAAAVVIRNANMDEAATISDSKVKLSVDQVASAILPQVACPPTQQHQSSVEEEQPQIRKTAKKEIPKWFKPM